MGHTMTFVLIYTVAIVGLMEMWTKQTRFHSRTRADGSREDPNGHANLRFQSRSPFGSGDGQDDLTDEIRMATIQVTRN